MKTRFVSYLFSPQCWAKCPSLWLSIVFCIAHWLIKRQFKFKPDQKQCTGTHFFFNIYNLGMYRVLDVYHVFFSTGVGTKIDPMLCRADRMVGQVLGAVNALPDIYTEITISFFLLRRLLGVKTEGDKKGAKVKL